MAAVWKDKADSMEHETCQAFGVNEFREYIRSPAGFFQAHLSRYSKSRRNAPIYWPLSTPSGFYTIWLYYPRLSENTIYECVTNFIGPKLDHIRKELASLRTRLQAKPTEDERSRHEELAAFESELDDLRKELERVAGLGYKPDLDDGVLINACPLYSLFRLARWRRDLEECWISLEKGEFDWAHLALALWPERVRDACRRDRSIAIAHGLEELYQGPAAAPDKPKRGRRKKA